MLQYLEPRTDVPAKDDWSTRLALASARFNTDDRVIALVAAATFVVTLFVPWTSGNRIAMVVLVGTLVMYLLQWMVYRGARRPLRRGLLDEPWRRVPAAVADKQQNDRADRVLLDGLVLKGSFGDLPTVVLDRQEVFVCGPDASGRAVLRAAGSTSMYQAEVDEGQYPAREREARTLGRPGDERQLQDGIRKTRGMRMSSWLFVAMALAIIWILIANSVSPLAPTGLIAAALLTPALLVIPAGIEVGLRERAIAKALANSEAWTPVPITLLPWQRGHHVAGIADLPDGPALVRFPRPWIDLVANIADTKVMWIAGTDKDILAVGVPGTSLLNFAEVRPEQDAQRSVPLPWWRRYRQPDFGDLPH